jgi:hypothetical protein
MKTKALCVLAGIAAPLIATQTSDAGFVGLVTLEKQGSGQAAGYIIRNVYAVFDRPGDRLLSVYGTPQNPIDVHVVGGTFKQYPGVAGLTGPTAYNVFANANNAYDTFISFGVKIFGTYSNVVGQPYNSSEIFIAGDLAFTASALTSLSGGWAPTGLSPLGLPDNPNIVGGANSFGPGVGSVLIGQFTTSNGTDIQGTVNVQVLSNGNLITLTNQSVNLPTPGALALLGTAGLIGTRRRRRRK